VGGYGDNSFVGATWIFVKNAGVWTQQGNKIVGTGNISGSRQGTSVSLNYDGTRLAVGGNLDNGGIGATWVFSRSGTSWTQETKLIGTGFVGNSNQGASVSLNGDATVLVVGGPNDNTFIGAAWIFTRTGTTWTQLGTKLISSDYIGSPNFGSSVCVNYYATTIAIGGSENNSGIGATWIYTTNSTNSTNSINNQWTQQGNALIGSGYVGTIPRQGTSVSLSYDGNTLAVGGVNDDTNKGATWIFTRNINNKWSQQGSKLYGSASTSTTLQGGSISLSYNGNTLIIGGKTSMSSQGNVWIFG
jgi:hypothetical protein